MDVRTALRTSGFVSVMGYQETVGGNAKEVQVRKAQPMTWDSNNGVVVVYDDFGDPWIAPTDFLVKLPVFSGKERLRRGAYVPFSSDGGYRIRQLFPTAYRR